MSGLLRDLLLVLWGALVQVAGPVPAPRQEGSAAPETQEAKDGNGSPDADRALLAEPDANPLQVRSAVRRILGRGEVDVLRALLMDSAGIAVRKIILEEWSSDPSLSTELRASLIPEALQLTMEGEEELAAAARNYLDVLAHEDRAVLEGELARILSSDLPPALQAAAARTAGSMWSFALLDVLIGQLERGAAGCQDVTATAARALAEITLQDFGTDAAAWRRWQRESASTSPEALIRRAYADAHNRNRTQRAQITDLWRRLLKNATAEECVKPLADEIPEVRLLALQRVLALAQKTNGERDATLPAARAAVEQRLKEPLALPAEEVRTLCQILSELGLGDPAARDLLLQRFVATPDPALKGGIIDSLRTFASKKADPAIAGALMDLFESAPPAELQARVLPALSEVGEEPALVLVLPHCHEAREPVAEVRAQAVQCAADIALRVSEDRKVEVFEMLVEVLAKDTSDEVRSVASTKLQGLVPKLSPEQWEVAFSTLKDTISANLERKRLVDQYTKSMCKIPGYERRTLAEILSWLAKGTPGLEVTLLQRILDFAQGQKLDSKALEVTFPALAAFLPYGGRIVEPYGPESLSATQALAEILKRADEEGRGVDARINAADACRNSRRFAWSSDLLREVEEAPGGGERNLTWARAQDLLSVVSDPDYPVEVQDGQSVPDKKAIELWDLLSGYRSGVTTPAGAPSPKKVLMALVQAASRVPREYARPGAEAGDRLLELMQVKPERDDNRGEYARRTAQLWFDAGECNRAYTLLEAEFPGSTSLDVTILKAKAARCSTEDVKVAIALYEQLLGTGAEGGLLARDHREYLSLALDLVELYTRVPDWENARRALASVPGGEEVPVGILQRKETLENVIDRHVPREAAAPATDGSDAQAPSDSR